MDTAKLREHVVRVVESGKQIYIFSTVDQDRPRARYMGTLNISDDYSVFYLACKASSNKVRQIRANPNSQLLFITPDYMEIATLSGKSCMDDDPAPKREMWEKNPAMAGYFKSVDDPDLAIIRFEAEVAEYSSHANNYEAISMPWKSTAAVQQKARQKGAARP